MHDDVGQWHLDESNCRGSTQQATELKRWFGQVRLSDRAEDSDQANNAASEALRSELEGSEHDKEKQLAFGQEVQLAGRNVQLGDLQNLNSKANGELHAYNSFSKVMQTNCFVGGIANTVAN